MNVIGGSDARSYQGAARAPAGCALADRDGARPDDGGAQRRSSAAWADRRSAGDLAAAALFDRLTKPMLVARGYELPSWAPPGSAVLCSSYSGDTEETLACYAAAEAVGAQRLVATTGGELAELARRDGVPVIGLPAGLQPRAAVGYMFCVAAELAALALAGPRINTEIDAAASHLVGAMGWSRVTRERDRRTDRGRRPGHLRQRPHHPGRLSLEDPGEREREVPGLFGAPARRPTTTSSRAGRAPMGASRRSSSRTETSTLGSGGASS